MDIFATLLHTGYTVFTYQEIKHASKLETDAGVKSFLQRAKKSHRLLNPLKGIRTFPIYNTNECACKIFDGAYISLETVLYDVGVIFQWYGNSTKLIGRKTYTHQLSDHTYELYKIKKKLLDHSEGIQSYDTYRIATPERALCDLIYLFPGAQIDNPQYFDNPQSKTRLEKYLLPFYPLTTQRHVRKLLARKP
jgi:hypothetical protein